MASVYRAKQKTFQRDVALKVLRQDLGSDEKYSERFVQESQIIAKLHHSHVVQVYDVGQFKNLFYVAMEFLNGRNLSEMLRMQRVDRKRAVRIFSQIASALDYSHQKGIVHRDVKPDNIMFRDDQAAVLTDFGIAKDTDAAMELTQTGTIMGTPKYMSPEQIRGGTVSPSSDLYSLGVVFFQMLTGAVPFTGSTLVEVAVKHLNEPIPAMPEGLEHFQTIIDKILAKKPEDRYHRGKEILQDLAKVEHQSISVLLDSDDEYTPPPAPPAGHGQDNQDSIDTTVTHHDGVTLLSLEGIEPSIDATTIRMESPVSGNKYGKRAVGHDSVALAERPVTRANVAELKPPTKPTAQPQPTTRTPAAEPQPNQEPISASQWEQNFDSPTKESTSEPKRKNTNWTLYSAFAIGLVILVVIIAQLAPSIGPSDIPQLDARQAPEVAVAPPTEPQDAAPSSDNLANTPANNSVVVEQPTETPALDPAAAEQERIEAEIAQLLESARQNEKAARLTKPLGNNALVKYRQVLALQPGNEQARLGIGRIADHFVSNAEQFPSKENMGIAYSVMSDVRDASPNNPYLIKINERLKVVTDNTRASTSHADSLYRKLQVQGLLRSAEIDEREGRLIAPEFNNALDKYRKVLELDPENKIAAQRLEQIEQ